MAFSSAMRTYLVEITCNTNNLTSNTAKVANMMSWMMRFLG
jgi:hypothetical protein